MEGEKTEKAPQKVLKASKEEEEEDEEEEKKKTRSRVESSSMFNDDGCATVITIIIGGIPVCAVAGRPAEKYRRKVHIRYNHDGIHFRPMDTILGKSQKKKGRKNYIW